MVDRDAEHMPEEFWTTVARDLSSIYGGGRLALYGSTPCGDQIQRFGEQRLGDPELTREEALFCASSSEPIVQLDDRTLLSVRHCYGQMAVVVFEDEGRLAQAYEWDPLGNLPRLVLGHVVREVRTFDRLMAGLWAEQWADLKSHPGGPRGDIELMLQQALNLLHMQWGYVAITSPNDPAWLRQIASAGVYPPLPEYLPADYALYKRVRDNRLPAALELTPKRWDRLNNRALHLLLTRCDKTQVNQARDTLARVRRCYCQPLFDERKLIGLLVLHDPHLHSRFRLDDAGLYVFPHLVDRLQLEVRAAHTLVRSEIADHADEISPADAVDMLPLNEALNTLCQQLAEKVMVEAGPDVAYRAATLIYVPHENTLIMNGRDGPWSGDDDTIKVPLVDRRSVAARAFHTRKASLVSRIAPGGWSNKYLPNIPNGMTDDPTRSTVAIPIRAKSNVLGVVVVDSTQPLGLTYGHLVRLERMVARYAEPINRYHRVQHMDELEGLIRGIGGRPPEQQHHEGFLRLAVEIGGARYGSLFVRSPRTGKLEGVARSPGQPATGLLTYAFGEGLTGSLAHQRAVIRLDSLSPECITDLRRQFKTPQLVPSWEADTTLPTPDTESPSMFVTMEAHGEVIGIVRLRKAPHERFSAVEEELVHQAANRYAEVIQRSFERVRTATLVGLAESTQSRFWPPDPTRKARDIVDVLFDSVGPVLGWCEMAFWLIDQRPDARGVEVEVLRCITGRTADGNPFRPRSLELRTDALESWAWRTGEHRYEPDHESGTSALALPLRDRDDRVRGVLSVRKAVPWAFTTDEIEFLRQAAGLTTGAVLLHRGILVNQLVADMEEVWLRQFFTSGATDTGGGAALRRAEQHFFRDSLVEVVDCVRAVAGRVAVAVDGRLQLLPTDDPAAATAGLTLTEGAWGFLADSAVTCLAFRTSELFSTAGVDFPEVCFAVPFRHDGTLQAVYFLFDDAEERVSFGRVQEFAGKIGVVAQTITLAREWVRQTSLQRAISALGVLGTMVVNAHHDLRGPLSRVLTNLDDWPEGERTPLYELVRDDAALGLEAINKLIYFLEDSRTPRLNVSITDCVNDARRRILRNPRDHSHGPVIRFAEGHDHQARVLGLQEQLTGALEHLFQNGIRATKDKGADGYVEVAATPANGKFVQVIVQDNGVGMPEDVRQRIFQPFYKVHSNGTGLGLPAVYAVVKYHGGDIRVASTPGVGTTFTITLPTC
mgnify:CR=1 FL=1